MFCRNCGNEVDDNAVACMKCGHNPKVGSTHCPNCGVTVEPGQIVCVKCGGSLAAAGASVQLGDVSTKDKTVYLILAILLGSLGIHNFYAGYAAKGVIQLLATLLSCGFLSLFVWIWAIVEGVTVEKDSDGRPFKK